MRAYDARNAGRRAEPRAEHGEWLAPEVRHPGPPGGSVRRGWDWAESSLGREMYPALKWRTGADLSRVGGWATIRPGREKGLEESVMKPDMTRGDAAR